MVAQSYRKVAAQLRARIESGQLAPGDAMPTEADVAKEFGVGLTVVRNAFATLGNEGLVSTGGGRSGRRVRAHRPLRWVLTEFERGQRRDDAEAGVDDWAAAVIAQGRAPRQDVSVAIIPAPRNIARHLEVEEADLLVRRRRVRLVDEEPVQLSDSWFPESIARDTVLMEPRDIAMAGGIMRSIGHPQVRIHDEIRVRMPTPEEAAALDLATGPVSGAPVGEHTRVGIGADGHPVRVMVTVFGSAGTYLVYDQDV